MDSESKDSGAPPEKPVAGNVERPISALPPEDLALSDEQRDALLPKLTKGAGRQGSKLQLRVGAPTDSIRNTDGIAIEWSLIEETTRKLGIAGAANVHHVTRAAIQARKDRHKWKRIPDGRSLAVAQGSSGEITDSTPGDFTKRIAAHRERVFQTASNSLGKIKRISIRGARDYDIVDKIARRAAGINDDDVASANVLIHINEAVEEHEAPIEAHEVIPCLTDSPSNDSLGQEAAKQVFTILDDEEQRRREASHVTQANVSIETSRTLNPFDSKRRRFVLPGVIRK